MWCTLKSVDVGLSTDLSGGMQENQLVDERAIPIKGKVSLHEGNAELSRYTWKRESLLPEAKPPCVEGGNLPTLFLLFALRIFFLLNK